MSWFEILKGKRADRKKERMALSPSTKDLDYIDGLSHDTSKYHWKNQIKAAKIESFGDEGMAGHHVIDWDKMTNREWAQMALDLDPEFELTLIGRQSKMKLWYHGDMR
tara:strand:+ start:928 stop:1251 length:324 start_codon:yes stop_codon:yes gene_type:complete